ncbi:protein ABHD8-like [Xenia sp. Carnegie-2017]|uniref:protein ABHD8-like n=1 Tax=Xenia sp. Carnegie-2017 TaxID=2897299 RepID=UPI001F0484E6|nr:protein ABHD8-like [Xenia sp. Carnegie-2017]
MVAVQLHRTQPSIHSPNSPMICLLYLIAFEMKRRTSLLDIHMAAHFVQRLLQATPSFKMILISGGGPIPLNPPPCHFFCLPSIILACLKSCVIWRFQRMSFHGRSSQDKIHLYQAFKAPTHVLRAIMVGQRWNEGDEQLHSDIMVPTLLIYGNNDKLVTMEEEMHMNQTIYGSTLEVLDDVGHMVMLECSQRVNELIRQFLCRDVSTKSDQLIANQSEPGLDGAC